MKTRCKFVCQEVTTLNATMYDNGQPTGFRIQRVTLEAQYDDGLIKENASYAAATPDGKLTFTVTNPRVHGMFEPGKAYYLDLTDATPVVG